MLDLLPPEDWVPWRLIAADVLVGGAVAFVGYRIFRSIAARPEASSPTRRWFVRRAWTGLVVGALLCRGFYGPPIRLLLTAKCDRPAQRFADQFASSPEIRAWQARRTTELKAQGESEEMIPRTLAYERSELVRNGFPRLDDARLALRTDLLARALATADRRTCAWILTGTARDIENALGRLTPPARGAWFDLAFDATLAEIHGDPPPVNLGDDEKRATLADLRATRLWKGLRALQMTRPSESQSSWQLQRCEREQLLYSTVSAWRGPRRAAADRLLASLDADLTGELGDEPAP